jgi:hypothetical protein
MNESATDRALLFQYGSNMSEDRLAAKIREHQSYAPEGAELDASFLFAWTEVGLSSTGSRATGRRGIPRTIGPSP